MKITTVANWIVFLINLSALAMCSDLMNTAKTEPFAEYIAIAIAVVMFIFNMAYVVSALNAQPLDGIVKNVFLGGVDE